MGFNCLKATATSRRQFTSLWTLNYVDCVLFSCKKESCQSCKLILKSLNLELAKNMIKPPLYNLINLFDFMGWLWNYIVFDKIKWLCAFTKYITKFDNKAPIHVNELILTAFSPFEIKCKILKTSGIIFIGHLGGWVFHIFPRLYSIMCVCVWEGILDTF